MFVHNLSQTCTHTPIMPKSNSITEKNDGFYEIIHHWDFFSTDWLFSIAFFAVARTREKKVQMSQLMCVRAIDGDSFVRAKKNDKKLTNINQFVKFFFTVMQHISITSVHFYRMYIFWFLVCEFLLFSHREIRFENFVNLRDCCANMERKKIVILLDR